MTQKSRNKNLKTMLNLQRVETSPSLTSTDKNIYNNKNKNKQVSTLSGSTSTFKGVVTDNEEVIQRLEKEVYQYQRRIIKQPISIHELRSQIETLKRKYEQVKQDKEKNAEKIAKKLNK